MLPWIFTLCALALVAARGEELSAILGKRLVDPEMVLEQVRVFAEQRIPKMPEVGSRAEWEKQAREIRERVLKEVVLRGKAAEWDELPLRVEWLDEIEGGPGYRIRKLRYEAVPGSWIPALLYEPLELRGKAPVVLNVNGHDPKGKAADYKQIRCINQAKRGMLALNVEWFGMGQLRGEMGEHYRMNQLDLTGTPGLAPFYFALKRGIDVLLSVPQADSERVAVTGLSGGAWQTIFISSLDERVTLANPVAGYSSFFTRARVLADLGDSEQTPSDLATVADYTHLTALRAPRPTLLTYNEKDNCCFATPHALQPLVDAAGPIFELYGKGENLRTHNNFEPGTHNFEQDNRQQLYRMLGDHFFPNDPGYSAEEIECGAEVKSAEELQVAMPEGNKQFNALAGELAEGLPRVAGGAKEAQRKRLRELTQTHEWKAEGIRLAGAAGPEGVQGERHLLQVGGAWTVGVVELKRSGAKGTVLLVGDQGRAKLGERAAEFLKGGTNVVAFDPFYFGESAIQTHDHLFALLVAAVGERPLGIQASQMLSVAKWWKQANRGRGLAMHVEGERLAVAALVAAALEPGVFGSVNTPGAFESLHEVITQNWAVNQKPELFCFGLLAEFDLPQIRGLASSR